MTEPPDAGDHQASLKSTFDHDHHNHHGLHNHHSHGSQQHEHHGSTLRTSAKRDRDEFDPSASMMLHPDEVDDESDESKKAKIDGLSDLADDDSLLDELKPGQLGLLFAPFSFSLSSFLFYYSTLYYIFSRDIA